MIKYTYQQFEDDINRIVNSISGDSFKPDVIVGLSRGGLMPAVVLSHRLNVPMVPVTWQTRDGKTKDKEVLNNVKSKYNNILVVDDICDSGLTLREISSILKAKYVVLIDKAPEKFLVDYAGRICDSDEWIEFFWE